MYLDWNIAVPLVSVVTALGTALACLLKAHGWVLRQDRHAEQLAQLRAQHADDIRHLKEENALVCTALSACLDGLQQLGANHSVPLAKAKLDAYLNTMAHQ